jgi:hypothetical protein
VCGMGAACRAHGTRARAVSASCALVRRHSRAPRGQARLRDPRHGGFRGRYEGSQSARRLVRSNSAIALRSEHAANSPASASPAGFLTGVPEKSTPAEDAGRSRLWPRSSDLFCRARVATPSPQRGEGGVRGRGLRANSGSQRPLILSFSPLGRRDAARRAATIISD